MPKFTILWLISLTTILAVLFAVAGQTLQYAYFLSCLLLACYTGFASRFLFDKSHAASITIAAITSTAVGGSLLAIGTWYTPISPSAVDFIGSGRYTIGGSFIVGSILGYCFSIFALLSYASVIAWKWLRVTQKTRHANL